jgi:hypothetical protein
MYAGMKRALHHVDMGLAAAYVHGSHLSAAKKKCGGRMCERVSSERGKKARTRRYSYSYSYSYSYPTLPYPKARTRGVERLPLHYTRNRFLSGASQQP